MKKYPLESPELKPAEASPPGSQLGKTRVVANPEVRPFLSQF